MFLLDASVLINFVRKPDPVSRKLFASAPAAICGVTRAEVLQGARDIADTGRLTAALDQFVQIPTPEGVWQTLGVNLAELRLRGLNLPFQDVLLATVAVCHDLPVWTSDRYFALMRNVLTSLKLYTPPASP